MPILASQISETETETENQSSAIKIQYEESKEELRRATIKRAQREVDNPDLYFAPDQKHRELNWTIDHLKKQFNRLERRYLSEQGKLLFIGCSVGEHKYCRVTVDDARCSCFCHGQK